HALRVWSGRLSLRELLRDGRLVGSCRDGRFSGPGFLDGPASPALAFFSLLSATGDEAWYGHAMELIGELDRFARPEGRFFSTPDDGPELLKRPFDLTDNPHPSGTAVAAEALFLASLYTGDPALRDRAGNAVAAIGAGVERAPTRVAPHPSVAAAVSRSLEP